MIFMCLLKKLYPFVSLYCISLSALAAEWLTTPAGSKFSPPYTRHFQRLFVRRHFARKQFGRGEMSAVFLG